ncbi:CGNR zinc finger domain-containing protein [Pseudonocardia zijingensis]|uniref:CGNR zinc finger domain-containing protein n=1 Tax=Pseudonocardia zijingensis TaxID=153376 RepID=A0ABN1PR29_9PSEU
MPEEIGDLLPDEPLPVRLMNTVWAGRHRVHDDLATVDGLRLWFERTGLPGAEQLEPADLAALRRLRDAVRRIAAHVTGDDRPGASAGADDLDAALATVNAEAAACMPALVLDADGRPVLRWHAGGREADRARAELALEAARLLGGAEADLLRACHGPGCVLYFRKDHPRRGWCSAGCGNRARVARHYDRHRRHR